MRERFATRGEDACEAGLALLLYACMLLPLRNPVIHTFALNQRIGWLLMSVIAAGIALLGCCIALAGWAALCIATRAPASFFEDRERPWLFEDEDGQP